jgi:hypothetical protein
MRRVWVLVAVLVLGAWTCAPVDDGGADMSMTTPGLAALIQGEPWRYPGDTDQPAFENGWGNLVGSIKLAFRMRTPGVMDIYGVAQGGTPGSTIITVPEDYWPNREATSN